MWYVQTVRAHCIVIILHPMTDVASAVIIHYGASVTATDNQGRTPLHVAAMNNHTGTDVDD
jgi:ankyrin repeat protein